jgi:hypothetical protein
MAFCDGAQHNSTVIVDEHGAVVGKSNEPLSNTDFSLEAILVTGHSLVS